MTTKTNELNDSIDDLFGISEAMNIIKPTPRTLPTDPQLVRVREMTPEFVEQCPKCRGSGRFTSWSGRQLGECFACKGRGQRSFKSSPDQRERARDSRAALPVRRWEAFVEKYPTEAAWIVREMGRFDFATKMKVAVEQYGDLTVNQMAAVQKCATRAVEKSAANSSVVDASKILEAFQSGRSQGLEDIKLRFEGITMKPAHFDPTGNTILVKAGRINIGKIEGGHFVPFRACAEDQKAKVILICSDPAAAAKAYGFATSSCCVCGRKLTNEESVTTGIGPICGGRMGWTPGRLKVSFSGDSRPDEF